MTEETEFGVRYVVDGAMRAPDETLLNVRSVWYIDAEGDAPRFVTANPLGTVKSLMKSMKAGNR